MVISFFFFFFNFSSLGMEMVIVVVSVTLLAQGGEGWRELSLPSVTIM